MGTLVAIAIFIGVMRYLGGAGVHPLAALGISLAATIVIYESLLCVLDQFLGSLFSSTANTAVAIVGTVVIVAVAAYAIGHRNGASGGSPFKPF